MKKGTTKKKIQKQLKKPKARRIQNDNQEDSQDLQLQDLEQPPVLNTQENFMSQTPQQKRIRLAKQMLKQLKGAESQQKNLQDDFFLQQNNHEFQPIHQDKHEQIDNMLKQDYMKKHNLFYNKFGQNFKSVKWSEGVTYKGHTKGITAVQVCPSNDNFYSCSKDGSIIRWDKQTKKKTFLSYGKQQNHHQGQILCMSLNTQGTILATGSQDATIKLWDTKSNQLIDTLKSHKSDINGLKFGLNSNNLCSISSDRTFKLWDAAERVFIDTFYGHKAEGLDIDCINNKDFITSGFDNQVITWKTEKQTQVIYTGHDYAIDRVRMVNSEHFLTASQDASVYLWNVKKKKPIFKFQNAHQKNWVCSLGTSVNSDIFATGAYNESINLYQINDGLKGFSKIHELPCKGFITDIKIQGNTLYAAQSEEHRLGRWKTLKAKNQIKIFNFLI